MEKRGEKGNGWKGAEQKGKEVMKLCVWGGSVRECIKGIRQGIWME
jgi:hypothetical protein